MTDTSGTTVVLGWDALDAKLLEKWGLWDSFGDHHSRIGTYANPVIGEPHTREVWPTIISGISPDEHGIHAVTEQNGVQWSSPALKVSARIAQHAVPDGLQTWAGRQIRSHGAGVEKYDVDYYHDQGISTLFDGRRSLPIGIPNYRTELDEEHGFLQDRGAEMGEWITRDADGWRVQDAESQVGVEQMGAREAGAKLGLIHTALQRDYDIIFAWFGEVDTAGHVEPCAAEPYQRRAYGRAARWTEGVRNALGEDDRLVCVSDHGLRDGHHTMEPVITSNDPDVVEATDSVYDVRETLDSVTQSRGGEHPISHAPIRAQDRHDRASAAADAGEVQDRLENLGYV